MRTGWIPWSRYHGGKAQTRGSVPALVLTIPTSCINVFCGPSHNVVQHTLCGPRRRCGVFGLVPGNGCLQRAQTSRGVPQCVLCHGPQPLTLPPAAAWPGPSPAAPAPPSGERGGHLVPNCQHPRHHARRRRRVARPRLGLPGVRLLPPRRAKRAGGLVHRQTPEAQQRIQRAARHVRSAAARRVARRNRPPDRCGRFSPVAIFVPDAVLARRPRDRRVAAASTGARPNQVCHAIPQRQNGPGTTGQGVLNRRCCSQGPRATASGAHRPRDSARPRRCDGPAPRARPARRAPHRPQVRCGHRPDQHGERGGDLSGGSVRPFRIGPRARQQPGQFGEPARRVAACGRRLAGNQADRAGRGRSA
jgi:hypothetical protein